MTTSNDFEREIRAMLVERAPEREPARLFDAVMAGSTKVRQRPALLIARMPAARTVEPRALRVAPLLVILGLLILAIAVAAVLVGGGARYGGIVSPTPSASIASTASARPPTPTPIAILPGEPWILYERFVDLGGGLYLMRPDGSDDHRVLADIPGVHKEADWSPDGNRVVFTDNETETLWIAGIDGSDPQHIPCPLRGCSKPAWSPDGTKIAYSRVENGPAIGPFAVSIEILDIASGDVSTVIRLERPLLADVPEWSPDGTQLVIGVDKMEDVGTEIGAAVAIVPVAGGEPRYLTDFDLFGYMPDWSPKGDQIVFSTEVSEAKRKPDPSDDTWDLYAVQPDGSGLRTITNVDKGTRLWRPSWTPDGSRILASIQGTRQAVYVDSASGAIAPVGGTDLAAAWLRPTP